jgi:hypothetical protein
MSLQLQTLSDQFNTILSQYQNTYQDYLNAINSNDKNLIIVDNTALTGGNIINTTQSVNIDTCQITCKNNDLCTGATFNISNNNCSLNNGNISIVNSSNSKSIVQKGVYYSYQLQQLNQQLLDLNKQIMDITNQSYSNYQQDIQKSRIQEETLQKNYQILLDERIQIEQMMREFETLNSANENGQINVTSNYYKYIIFLFIALFLVFILIRYSSDITQRGGGKYIYNKAIWLFMIIFIAIMILNYKTILAI